VNPQDLAGLAEFPLECPRCRIAQKVHLATKGTGGPQTIECLNCKNVFEMDFPNRIVGGTYIV
jgi:transcription elongation factor Elf1